MDFKSTLKQLFGFSKQAVIMRLTLILFTFSFFEMTAAGYSQDLNLELRKAKLETVFKQIEKQSGYVFFYRSDIIKDVKKVSISVSAQKLETILDELLEDSGLTYTVEENTVVIKKDPLFKPQSDPTQEINGKIIDESGEPILGATIRVKGTTTGTTSDISGTFNLDVNSGDVLIISFVGYSSQEIAVSDSNYLEIVLAESASQLEDLVVVGSRGFERSTADSPSPIDIIQVGRLSAKTGRVDLNQIMQYAAPSFNSTKQSGSDGADHVDPASLRGLGPDQTLVLVNGKRRHQSSLVNVFGTRGRGNSGTDLNAIPVAAIKRIEVLRDGASAQYGSDAIAGVINIVLKDKTDGVTGGVTYGAYSTSVGADYEEKYGSSLFNVDGKQRALDSDGDKSFDGNTVKVDLNYGTSIGDDGGYINFTTEYLTKQRTLRPGYAWRQGYGSAAVDQFQFMVNSVLPLAANTELYFFGGIGDRDTDAFAFSRDAPGIEGDDRAVSSLYPNGFTPRITSVIKDNSATAGVRHDLDNGWKADFSHSYGSNIFNYFIKNSNNASLGSASPTDFDAGGHSLSMNVTALDFTKFNKDIAAGMNVAFGLEYRSENFQIFAGEEASYASYDVNGVAITNPAVQSPFLNEFGRQPSGSSQGFPGYSPQNEVDRNRSNIGFYGDVEINATEDFLIGGAVRYENYSDFGNTFNYKLAARYKVIDGLSLRTSISTGFRAPSLAQIHYNLLFNNIIAGRSERTLLASNTSSVAKGFGIQQLKQEEATNLAVGFTYRKGGFTATVDAYQINVDDRIVLTDVFDASTLNVGADAAQFFANGVDTKTTGVDIVLSYQHFLSDDNEFNIGVAANFNNTEIEKINNGNLNQFTFFGPFSQAYLEAAAPDHKINFNAGLDLDRFSIQMNYTLFSEVRLQDFQWVDTPATTQAEADALFAVATDVYESMGTLDLSVGYDFKNNLTFTVGANNIFNKYPTPQFDGWTDQGGFNDSVQMGSDGMYLFGRLGFRF